MPYVKRGDNGEISALYDSPTAEAIEYLEIADAEVQHFIVRSERLGELKQDLLTSDTNMARVLEDLIDALVRKGTIALSDLPPAARDKLERRRSLRTEIREIPIVPADDII
jgi:predicted metal-dependent hydrolase